MCRIIIIFLSALLFSGNILHAQYTPAEIRRVSVNPETSMTSVYFTGTDHPDVNFYYVMQLVNEADGIALMSSYTEDIGDPDHLYEVLLDIPEVDQGPVGLYIRPHQDASTPLTSVTSTIRDSTMFIDADYDWCLNTIDLSWNGYNRWRDRILHFRLMMKVNDENPIVVAELPEETTTYQIGNLSAGNDYLFFVVARRTNLDPTQYVMSNGARLDTLETVYPEYIHADFATLDNGVHPVVQFTGYPASDIETFAILRSTEAQGSYDTINILETTASEIRFTDQNVDASTQPYYYKLVAVNSCNKAVLESENMAGTIYLTGALQNERVSLDWTGYRQWLLGVADYQILRSFGDNETEIIATTGNLSYEDDLSGLGGGSHSNYVCYRINALETPGDPHVVTPAESMSNPFCVTLPMDIEFLFNAFTPGSAENSDFGPYMRFLPTKYDFRIFDRNGSMIFQSEDPVNTPRWDGRLRNGAYANQGVYRYSLLYEDEYGNRSVLQGNVTVIR